MLGKPTIATALSGARFVQDNIFAIAGLGMYRYLGNGRDRKSATNKRKIMQCTVVHTTCSKAFSSTGGCLDSYLLAAVNIYRARASTWGA